MNSKLIASAVVAIAALGSASAFAQSQTYVHPEAVQGFAPVASSSNLTRAEVNAQYLQARQAGALPVSQEAVLVAAPAAATNLTRADVRAQAVLSARASQLSGYSAI